MFQWAVMSAAHRHATQEFLARETIYRLNVLYKRREYVSVREFLCAFHSALGHHAVVAAKTRSGRNLVEAIFRYIERRPLKNDDIAIASALLVDSLGVMTSRWGNLLLTMIERRPHVYALRNLLWYEKELRNYNSMLRRENREKLPTYRKLRKETAGLGLSNREIARLTRQHINECNRHKRHKYDETKQIDALIARTQRLIKACKKALV